MLDAYKITQDTILRRLTTESEIRVLYEFLAGQTQVICPQKPFLLNEFLKTFLPILNHPKISVWTWVNRVDEEDHIIGAMVVAVKPRSMYATGLAFHKDTDVAASIPQLIADGKALLRLYGVNHIVFSVNPTSPQISIFNQHFTTTTNPPGAPPGSISYRISI